MEPFLHKVLSSGNDYFSGPQLTEDEEWELYQWIEKGKMNRRQLVKSLAVAASAASAVASLPAYAAETPLSVTRLDHLSYTVANYARTRDFYSSLLGMKVSHDDGKESCRLHATNGFLVARNGASSKPTGFIDHIGFKTEVKDKAALAAEIGRRGLTALPGQASDTGVHIQDPDGFNVQLDPKE